MHNFQNMQNKGYSKGFVLIFDKVLYIPLGDS